MGAKEARALAYGEKPPYPRLADDYRRHCFRRGARRRGQRHIVVGRPVEVSNDLGRLVFCRRSIWDGDRYSLAAWLLGLRPGEGQ